MHLFIIAAFVLSSPLALALTDPDKVTQFVPGGKVIQIKQKEYKVLTPKNSVVEIEFERNGDFEEASGDDIDRDNFNPGQGLMTLSDAVAQVRKKGKTISGDWSLEKSFLSGWLYEFEGFEKGLKMEYTVDATNGKIVSQKVDD